VKANFSDCELRAMSNILYYFNGTYGKSMIFRNLARSDCKTMTLILLHNDRDNFLLTEPSEYESVSFACYDGNRSTFRKIQDGQSLK
jgi:hypothetical protein